MDDNCCNSGIVSTTSGITADEETCPGNDDQLQMSLILLIVGVTIVAIIVINISRKSNK